MARRAIRHHSRAMAVAPTAAPVSEATAYPVRGSRTIDVSRVLASRSSAIETTRPGPVPA